MPDLTPEILPRIKGYSLPELPLAEGFIAPYYAGGSILNLPDSVCRFLGIPAFGAGPLFSEIHQAVGVGEPFCEPVRRVIMVLVDALSFTRLARWLDSGVAPVWSRLAQSGTLSPLTSVTPSTTSAGLTSLWTARSPAEHGVAGYELWLKEYGLVANMILHAPMAFGGESGSLGRAGFTPQNFMDRLTFGTHLAAHGVQALAFQSATILNSGLSQMFFQSVESYAYSTAADLWINLRERLEDKPDERLYAWVYWSEVDHFSHFYGPEDERTVADFAAFSQACEQLFLDRLSPAARQDTLLILTADHGQIATTPDPFYDLHGHPNLLRRLHIFPTGENRLAYLFARPGQVEAVREYLERTWPRQFSLLDPAYAVHAGLFGPGQPHPRLLDRLGDLLVAARSQAYLWWSAKENRLVGRHGGLSPEEMLVPFLAVRL